MKQLFLVIISFLFISTFAIAQRSQEMQSKTVKSASEVRASNFLDKLGSKVELSEEQKEQMADLIRDYIEDFQSLDASSEIYGKQVEKLETQRNNKAKKILKTEVAYNEYLQGIEDLKSQMGRGYGRR